MLKYDTSLSDDERDLELKKSNKFKCPECGKELKYWREETITWVYPLTKDRMKIKKYPESGIGFDVMNDGFMCSNPHCHWWCNGIKCNDNGNITSYTKFGEHIEIK